MVTETELTRSDDEEAPAGNKAAKKGASKLLGKLGKIGKLAKQGAKFCRAPGPPPTST